MVGATVAHTPGHTRDAAFDAELDFWILLALPPAPTSNY